MDQMSEHSETQEIRKLLLEILKVQELILLRVSQLEELLAREKRP